MIIIYLAFVDIKGMKFPSKQKIQLGAVDIELENTDIQINEMIDKKWYSN